MEIHPAFAALLEGEMEGTVEAKAQQAQGFLIPGLALKEERVAARRQVTRAR
jgi:hypothetical protein